MGTLAPPQDELASPSSLGSPFPDLIFPSPSFGSSIPADTDGVHYVLNSGFHTQKRCCFHVLGGHPSLCALVTWKRLCSISLGSDRTASGVWPGWSQPGCPLGRGGPRAMLGPLVCSITGPRVTAALCTLHGLVCLQEEFDLDLDSCGTVRDLWTDWALAGCCCLASVSDSFLTKILFFASHGLSTCPIREACPPAEALAGSHQRFLWGHLLRDHPLSVSSGEQEVGVEGGARPRGVHSEGLLASSVPIFNSQICSPTLAPVLWFPGLSRWEWDGRFWLHSFEQHTLKLECGWGLGPFLVRASHENLSEFPGEFSFSRAVLQSLAPSTWSSVHGCSFLVCPTC